MATTFEGTIKLIIDGLYKSSIDLGTAKETIGVKVEDIFASGTGDAQADLWTHDQRTVTNPTPDTIDLTSGLTDIFGTTFALVTLKGIVVHHTGSSGNLTMSGNAVRNAAFLGITTGQLQIQPGGWFALIAPNLGYTITDSTQDQLTFDSSTGAIVYDLYLLGTSA